MNTITPSTTPPVTTATQDRPSASVPRNALAVHFGHARQARTDAAWTAAAPPYPVVHATITFSANSQVSLSLRPAAESIQQPGRRSGVVGGDEDDLRQKFYSAGAQRPGTVGDKEDDSRQAAYVGGARRVSVDSDEGDYYSRPDVYAAGAQRPGTVGDKDDASRQAASLRLAPDPDEPSDKDDYAPPKGCRTPPKVATCPAADEREVRHVGLKPFISSDED
ncbi:hypothetical protein AB870_00105 [Pandoraea faecigallinarum]|uniref:Uncharacterized protein n=1 Tax=Pandoraea faecigallinarum TaxID=656179 RepID=A0A0H3WQQ5_9BURK|nr:hypothetical protein [Pandoraea faecigallinarum]AKM28878.1 hypothetical protein AB870_00105 [Pandoraea faecigallinarum]